MLELKLIAVEGLKRFSTLAASVVLHTFADGVEKRIADEEVANVLVRDAESLIEEWRA